MTPIHAQKSTLSSRHTCDTLIIGASLSKAAADDLRDGTRGIFYYVDALCYGIERSEIQQYWDETVYISPSDAYVEIYN